MFIVSVCIEFEVHWSTIKLSVTGGAGLKEFLGTLVLVSFSWDLKIEGGFGWFHVVSARVVLFWGTKINCSEGSR